MRNRFVHSIVFLILLGRFSSTVLASPPIVSNVRADFVSHSAVRLVWDNSQIPNAARIHFGFTTAYEGGGGGGIFVPGTASWAMFQYGQTASMSGW